MKVKMLTNMAGATDRNSGESYEIEDAEAKRLISKGFAEAVAKETKAKKAKAASKTETATTR